MSSAQGLEVLTGSIKYYQWGGSLFIPQLLGEKNAEQRPFAEYWLGAHASSPSVIKQTSMRLNEKIEEEPLNILGADVAGRFGNLPYLLKVLDVRQMLSIQVHPSVAGASEGFDDEEARGIAMDAPHRNYKDRNHKPELMVALSDFWLLHGFKNSVNLGLIFEATPELQSLQALYDKAGIRGLYEYLMNLPQETVNDLLHPLMQRILPLYDANSLNKDEEDFWAARAARTFCNEDIYDRGIFSIYLFNLVYLAPGEGIFQPEGLPHAYLEGQNIEVMANSDNVLRAGLTNKHIAVDELMKHTIFEPTQPAIISPAPTANVLYETTASEFELHIYRLSEGEEQELKTGTAEIFLMLEGVAKFSGASTALELSRGQAAIAYADTDLKISPLSPSQIVRVSVPSREASAED